MTTVWIYSILSVIAVSLVSLIGIFTIAINTGKLQKILIYMISFSAGGLLGDTFIHLLPEAVSTSGFSVKISIYVILGIAVSFIMEKMIHFRHCHHPTTSNHPHPFAVMNLFGDSVHNFIDGIIIGAAYLLDFHVGIATTIAVILHEIPQEIGDFGILLSGGFSKAKALFLNFMTALFSLIGVIVTLFAGAYIENTTVFLLPFASGTFIYIANADLIPELHKEVAISKSLLQFLLFSAGVGIMFLILLLE